MSETLIFRVLQTDEGDTEVAPVSESEEVGEEIETESGIEEEEHGEEEVANPILPTSNEMFYGAVFFFLLWALFKWVLLPPVLRVQETRAEQVRSDRDAADKATVEAARLQSDYEAGLTSARVEAGRIIDDARHASEQKRAQVMAQVDQEVAAERAQAAAEVEQARAAALTELKGGVASLAVEAASLVVQKDIDADAQRAAIDDYVSRADAS